MKTIMLFGLATLMVSSIMAADSTPAGDVSAAAKALGEKANYAWKTVIVVPEESQFKPGPTEGKTEKDGFTSVNMSFFDNKVQAVIKGEKGAVTDQQGAWKSIDEMEKEEGPGRFLALIARNIKTPAKEAAEIATYAKELKKDGDAYAGDLTEDGAKKLQTFGTRGSDPAPTVTNAKGSVKFWLKDGALTKYEFKLKGTISFNNNDFPNDRTTTVEIKDVGTTKVDVSEEARKKAS